MELLLRNYSDSDSDVDSKPDVEPPLKKAKISNDGISLDNEEEEKAGTGTEEELLLHTFSNSEIEIVIMFSDSLLSMYSTVEVEGSTPPPSSSSSSHGIECLSCSMFI